MAKADTRYLIDKQLKKWLNFGVNNSNKDICIKQQSGR